MANSPRRAYESSARNRRKEVNLDLSTARLMLPLVQSIVRDLVESSRQLHKLEPEQDRLERHRRDLVWAERNRRYTIGEEIAAARKAYKNALHELNDLGLDLLDKDTGRIGFPTRINGRSAVFSWQPGEESVTHWNYEEEELRRPIPTDWIPGTPLRSKGSRRHE
jgi:hypothetical protein